MNTSPAGFFSPKINGMDSSSRLPFFPADFIGPIKVSACKGITRRDGARAFIAELEVLQSNLPEAVRVGGKYSWYQGLTEADTAYPACIGFLYACLGLDRIRDKAKIEAEVKPKQDIWLNKAIDEGPGGQVLAGAVLLLQTSNKKLKDGKTDFTVHNFSPYVAPKAA
jgi:hypothetical protein